MSVKFCKGFQGWEQQRFSSANPKTAIKTGIFGAAAGDLSPLLSAGFCDGSQNTTTPSYDMGKWYVYSVATFSYSTNQFAP